IITGQPLFAEHNSLKSQIEICGAIDAILETKIGPIQLRTDADSPAGKKSANDLYDYSQKFTRADFIPLLRRRLLSNRGIKEADIDDHDITLKAFLDETLQYDPNRRMSAQHALAHDFLLDIRPLPKDEEQAMAKLKERIAYEITKSPQCP
ncbi:hypothetical protein PENTCL1PPCAC_5532, partial [Pristionchus entomophagus]